MEARGLLALGFEVPLTAADIYRGKIAGRAGTLDEGGHPVDLTLDIVATFEEAAQAMHLSARLSAIGLSAGRFQHWI